MSHTLHFPSICQILDYRARFGWSSTTKFNRTVTERNNPYSHKFSNSRLTNWFSGVNFKKTIGGTLIWQHMPMCQLRLDKEHPLSYPKG